MELVSIIIPVYKVEKYLNRCIESVINQTYRNIEIILVDDGSPDNCGKLCDEWAIKDNRIKVIHKENAGLAHARNSGLEIANGEYILFVDSDDYIKINTCENVITHLRKTKADFCYFEHIDDYNGEQIANNSSKVKSVYKGKEILFEFLANTLSPDINESGAPKISTAAWRVMYNKSFIKNNKIQFYSEREYLSEDILFRVELCKKAKMVTALKEAYYFYCHNDSSLTTSYRADRYSAAVKMYKKLIDDCKEIDINNILKMRCMRLLMSNVLICLKHEILYMKQNGLKSAQKNIKEICEDPTLINILKTYPLKKMSYQTRIIFKMINKKIIYGIMFLTWLKLKIE